MLDTFEALQLRADLPIKLAESGIAGEFLNSPDDENDGYNFKHRTNLSTFYTMPYLGKNDLTAKGLTLVDLRYILNPTFEGYHSNYLINGQLGLEMIDDLTKQTVARCGYDIWYKQNGSYVAVMSHTPQGLDPVAFRTRELRKKFLQTNFRNTLMKKFLDTCKKFGIKEAIVISSANHPKILDCFEDIDNSACRESGLISYGRGLKIIDNPALEIGFMYSANYNGNLYKKNY